MSTVTAMILAGGKGTRLHSLVSDRPKPLAIVSGRPFLEYLFDQLNDAGLNRVIVMTGYLGDQIKDHFGAQYKTLSLQYCKELIPLGTAGALRNALAFVSSKQVLVLNGDSYCDIDFQKLFETHNAKNALVTMAIVPVSDVSRFGAVTVAHDGRVMDFREKGAQTGGGFINAGIYLMNKSVLAEILPRTMISLEKDILPKYLDKSMYAYQTTGTFIDIGIPHDYMRAQMLFNREVKQHLRQA